MINVKETGQKIKEIREYCHLTQADFAEQLGVTKSAVCKWERGVKTPSLENVVKIMETYKVKFDKVIAVGKEEH